jgi:Glyoxalase-like domain
LARLTATRGEARFWAEALGYRLQPPPEGFDSWASFLREQGIPEDRWNDASAIVDPDGKGPRIYFQRVPEGKNAKNRMHMDLNVSGGRAVPLDDRKGRVDAEVARLKSLGATDERGATEGPPSLDVHRHSWRSTRSPLRHHSTSFQISGCRSPGRPPISANKATASLR